MQQNKWAEQHLDHQLASSFRFQNPKSVIRQEKNLGTQGNDIQNLEIK